MNALIDLLQKGGLIMFPMIALSVLLYERCFDLLFIILQSKRSLKSEAMNGPDRVTLIRELQRDLQATFHQHKLVISAMITAAPLLGLLGTVTGMGVTFNHLASGVGVRSMDGLSSGISEALIATETGLGIAIPALLVTYIAQRQLDK
ncbi:MAG: MotA/TolQ/ExbB proton channel family protein, partial [Opitutaceae bacterium]